MKSNRRHRNAVGHQYTGEFLFVGQISSLIALPWAARLAYLAQLRAPPSLQRLILLSKCAARPRSACEPPRGGGLLTVRINPC